MLHNLYEKQQPIIIIGAARSGTKMLRSVIGAHPDISKIPHDIEFIWKYKNYDVIDSELSVDLANENIRRYIHRYFKRYQLLKSRSRIVEKSVGNSLRVEFVRKIFPHCQFVHLIRDGRDVAVSAMHQWKASIDTFRIIRKLFGFPLRAIPAYGIKYLVDYISRHFNVEKSLATWGPRFSGIDDYRKEHSLLETCGYQWRCCVEKAQIDFGKLCWRSEVIEIKYETFVKDPIGETSRLFDYLNLDMSPEVISFLNNKVSSNNIGKWKRSISERDLEQLMRIIEPKLREFGYC